MLVKRLVKSVLAIGLVFVVVACLIQPSPAPVEPLDVPDAPTAEEGKVFKLGILGPFTGPSASTGVEFKNAATMALEAVDWHIGEYRIVPVWIDSQSDPDKAALAYEAAVKQDGIQAGILNWHSDVSVSCMEVTAKYKIPHFFGFGATEEVNEIFHSDVDKYGYWMNKGWPSPAKLSISYVQALEDAIAKGIWTPEEKTVAIYGENTTWGRSFGGAIKSQLEKAGWATIAEEYFSLEEVQFYPLLNELKAMNPALIAGTTTAAPSFSAFIKQADEVDLRSLIIADGLGWAGEWYNLTGESSNYIIDQIPGWATVQGQEFAKEFETRWGVAPSPSAAGLAYDGTSFFLAMAEATYAKTGELSSESIYNFVKENIWTGTWSYTDGIVMDEYLYTAESIPDPVVGEGYYIFPVLQYFDGAGKIIYPPNWAIQELTPQITLAEEAAIEARAFKLGIVGPFSGPNLRIGTELKAAVTMAFDAIDWQIGDQKIRPIWIDSQSESGEVALAYQQAIEQDHVQAGLLGWHSYTSVACQEVAAANHIPHLFGLGATEALNEAFHANMDEYGYWMLKGWPEPAKLNVSYVNALENAIAAGSWSPAEKTVAIYGEDTEWGNSFGRAIREQFENAGWQVVAEEYFDLEAVEFYPLLNKFKAQNPAVIAGTTTTAPSVSAFLKQADEIGLESLIIIDGLDWISDWYDATGAASDYVLSQFPVWTTAQGRAFATEFEDKWQLTTSAVVGGLAYDGANLFIAIAQEVYAKNGKITSDGIYNFVKDNVWTGKWSYTNGIVMDEYLYTAESIPDPVVGENHYIFPVLQYFEGEGKIIYPPERAEQELVPEF